MPALIEAQHRLLAASAISAGLWRVRSRSSPERLAREARQFVRLVAHALLHRDIAAAILAEVQTGAFACASPDEIGRVVEVWRGALRSSLSSLASLDPGRHVAEVLERIRDRAVASCRRWERERIDVVAVGASAGGLSGMGELLERLDAWVPATLILVLHVSPRGPSLVPAVLGRRAPVAVAAAVDGAALHLGQAFVAPPGHHLVVRGGVLRLVDGPPVHFVKPSADVLFESAAEACGQHLASVVLSGTGADGATGTRAVREHGGITFAEDPRTAEFSGMPEAAVATGTVDRALPIPRLGEALRRVLVQGRSALGR